MSDEKVLLVEGNPKHLRSLTRTMRAIVGTVEPREQIGAIPDDGDFELLIVNYDTLSPEDRKVLTARFGGHRTKSRLLLLSEGQCKDDFVELFGGHSLTNLVAKNNSEVDAEELIVTTRKILDHDIFGLQKYFIWGVEPRTFHVTKSSQKDSVVDAASEYAKNIGVNPRLINSFCSVADEFVTNAVYNAPRDKDGKQLYAHLPRTEEIALSANEAVEVQFCCDGRRLGISTSDPFGSLAAERLLDYLAKCLKKGDDQVDQKAGGAGLGFYVIFDAVSHFVVNVEPGKKTEMIGIIDITGSYRDFSVRHKSFNLFFEGEMR